MLRLLCLGLAGVTAAAALANGLFMLADPAAWYLAVPGVTDTGPYNQHFIRDIGLVFLLLAAAFALGLVRPAARVLSWGMAATWLGGHALFHLWEVAVGICAPAVLLRDFPAVSLPVLIGVGLTAWAALDKPARRRG